MDSEDITLHSTQTSSDFEITIKSDFIDRYVNALRYPLGIDLSRGDAGNLDLRNVEAVTPDLEERVPTDEISEHITSEIIPAALQEALDQRKGNEDADGPEGKTQSSLLAQRVEVESLSLSVIAPPKVALGPTMTVSGIQLITNATFNIGLTLFGKRRSVQVKLTGTEINGQRATLEFTTDGDNVFILPQLESISMTARIKILKWPFKYRLDLTNTINKRLKTYGPIKVLSLSGLIQSPKAYGDIALPTLKIQSLHFDDHAQGLRVGCKFDIIS